MAKIPTPPVPRAVRELLKNYPELIQRLQEALEKSHNGPLGALDLDGTIWLLKDMLGSDFVAANKALDQAEALGDAEAIRLARKKWEAISDAKHNIIGDGELATHFGYGKAT